MTNQRNIIFDQVKGILIILVIIGHVALGDVPENSLRTYLYFFHMPLFLAITGYFIRKSLLEYSIVDIFIKYKDRLIIPYSIAFLFYTLIQLKDADSIKDLIILILYPYYHLWYIPAMFLYIFYLKYLLKIKIKHNYLFFTIMLLFVLCTSYFEYYRQWNIFFENSIIKTIYNIIGDKRFYFYFSYFALGFYLANSKKVLDTIKSISICFCIALMGILIYIYPSLPIIQGFGKFMTNISLIYLVISFAIIYQRKTKWNSIELVIAKLGVVSLPIYLWHQLPIIIMKKFILVDMYLYIISGLFFIPFLYLFIKLEGENRLIDKFIYGKNRAS